MYYFLRGCIDVVKEDFIVIDVNGIGYIVNLSTTNKYQLGETYKVLTYCYHKEDNYLLIGFNSILERDMFKALLTVNGIGPKTACQIMRNVSLMELQGAIANENTKYLKSLPSIGAKTAMQIVLDLKKKFQKNNKNEMNEVRAVLRSFGYKTNEFEMFIAKYENSSLPVEEIIKCIIREIDYAH